MADNVSITAGSGTTIAADEPAAGAAAGAKVQRVKPMVGPDGEATDVSSANPMPVDDDGTQAILTLIKGLLEGTAVVKVTDNGGSLTIDAPLATPVAARLSDGSSAIGSTAQRLWIDDGGSTLSVDDGGGSLTVDGTVAVGEPTVKVAASQTIGLAAGSNAVGKLAANAGVNIGSVGLIASSHEGVEAKLVISAASTNSTLVKNAAGKVFGWHIFNKEAVPIYVKLYNASSAPTVGTTTQVMVIPIPAGAAANVEFTNGIAFATGIGLGITKGAANGNTEAVASEGVIVNLLFK